ncbi:MAG: hypothetical protein R3359_10250, partial [Marinirhabdus sp.]|nr:hypothetical protein [Marinirhabdus sp.]
SKGGSALIIPSANGRMDEYNSLLANLRLGTFGPLIQQEKQITQINFAHPLYADVFEKQVTNFQYPKVNTYYNLQTNANAALRFEDGKPFIILQGSVYSLSAPINNENSNFKNSPLIVPTLLNMAQQSLQIPQLYYNTGKQNTYATSISLLQDEIVTLKDSISSFVPMQQAKANSVEITTTDEPRRAGIYSLESKGTAIEDISYNYPRSESKLQYHDTADWEGVRTYDSIDDLFTSIAEENNIQSFWKWFVIFALLFLILEMLVLKFYKS